MPINTLAYYIIILIVVAAVLAIALVAVRHLGIQIPPAVLTVLWIVLVCAIAIIGIQFLVGLIRA